MSQYSVSIAKKHLYGPKTKSFGGKPSFDNSAINSFAQQSSHAIAENTDFKNF